ncbi:hypothetical protein CDAR_558911 [Caerostris darwini]|uniref:Bromo domain-containing protein n=1 Tax=Caerostris darwini TaxID=1538125 RepID=A0AAV4NAV6_9ARAC|nr:hypothetical protein CDAR_558911 [Caerostris darwini]
MSEESVTFENKKQEIQQMWQIASIAQFVSSLYQDLNLPEIEIEELEDGLLGKNEVGLTSVEDLMIKLLKGIYSSCRIGKDNLHQVYMPKAVRKIWKTEERQEENPLNKENTTFLNLDIKVKVDILNSLCYLRLDQPDAINALKEMDADSLRVQPLGCDDEGNEYWYFYGLRLYKQEPAREKIKRNWEVEWSEQKSRSFLKRGRGRPKKRRKLDGECDDFDDASMKKHGIFDIEEKSRWSAVCHDIEDWIEFAEKFKDSESKCEKELFNTVTRFFLPRLNEIYQAKEKKLQMKLRELMPKPVFTKMETRRQRNPPPPSPVNEDNYKKYLVQDRAQRLEERNRRLNGNLNKQSRKTRRSFEENSNIERRSKRLRRTSYDDDDEEEEDDFVEEFSPKSDDREDNILMRKKSGVKSLILQVLAEVKSQEDAVPFLFQMTESNAPGCYDIIKEPMDLSKIERKLRLGLYKTVDDIDNDFKIMLLNHQSYYGNKSEFVHKGKNIWRLFRRLVTAIKPNTVQDETVSRRIEVSQANEKDPKTIVENKLNNMNAEQTPEQEKETKTSPRNEVAEFSPESHMKKSNGTNIEVSKMDTKQASENQREIKTSPRNKAIPFYKEDYLKYLNKSNDINVERCVEHKKRKRKRPNKALEILSKEAELAVERSQSMDENEFRNLAQIEQSSEFPDLKVVPIHSHPSSLLEKFSSESSDQGSDENYSDSLSSSNSQNSVDSVINRSNEIQNVPENVSNVVEYLELNKENSDLTEVVTKNNPRNFNILSEGQVTNLNTMLDTEDLQSFTNNNLSFSTEDNQFNDSRPNFNENLNSIESNLSKESDNRPSSSIKDSVESYSQSSISCASSEHSRSPKDPAIDFPQPVEKNVPFLQNGFNSSEFPTFAPISESSTVDITCLGLASANIVFKKQQNQMESTSISKIPENDKHICKRNQNNKSSHQVTHKLHQAYNSDLKSEQELPKSRQKHLPILSDDKEIEKEFPNLKATQDMTYSSAVSTVQTVQTPLSSQGSPKNSFPYSAYMHESQIHNQESPKYQEKYSIFHDQETQNTHLTKNKPTVFLNQNNETITQKLHVSSHLDTKSQGTENQQLCSSTLREIHSESFTKSENSIMVSYQETQDQGEKIVQNSYSPTASHQHTENMAFTRIQPRCSPTSSFQEVLDQISNPVVTACLQSEDIEKGQPKHDPIISNGEISHNPSKDQQNLPNITLHETQSEAFITNYTENSIFISHQNNYNEIQTQESSKNQSRLSPVFASHQEIPRRESTQADSMHPMTEKQNFGNHKTKNSARAKNSQHHKVLKNQAGFASQEVQHQEVLKNQTGFTSQEVQQQEVLKNQTGFTSQQESAKHVLSRNSPAFVTQPIQTGFTSQEVQHQEVLKNQTGFTSQESAKHVQSRHSPVFVTHQPIHVQGLDSVKNQQRHSYQGTTNQLFHQQSAKNVLRYSSDFSSSQGTQNQLSNLLANSDQDKILVESTAFDPGLLVVNNSSNGTNNFKRSTLNPPVQIPVPYSNQNQLPTKTKFPAVKVNLPPSTGELLFVPDSNPSKMTVHLYAKPTSGNLQPIKRSLELHAVKNPNLQEISIVNEQTTNFANKNSDKQDTNNLPIKRKSPIQDLQHLALDPTGSFFSPVVPSQSSSRNKNHDNIPESFKSTRSSPKTSTSPFVTKPSIAPSDSLTINGTGNLRNNSFQPDSFVPRNIPLAFPNANRMPNYCGITTTSTLPMNFHAQMPVYNNSSSNTILQNVNGQYILMGENSHHSKTKPDISFQDSVMPPFYSSANMMQGFPLNAQVPIPQYMNPYCIVADSSAFSSNAPRYPIMSLQPIPFQNR